MISFVVVEYKKYQSEVFKISGFALMTPFARFILNLIEAGVSVHITQFLINVIASVLFFIVGIMVLQKGFEITWE